MRNLLIILLLLLSLPAPGHEGHEHEDLRETKTDEDPERVLSEQRELKWQGRSLRLTLRAYPKGARAGEPVELTIRLEERIDPPDPLLGEAAPVADLPFELTVQGPSGSQLELQNQDLALGEGRWLFTTARPGSYQLLVQAAGPPPLEAAFAWSTPAPLARRVALWASGAVLALWALVSLLFLRRWTARDQAAGWVVATLAAGGLFYWGSFPPALALAPTGPAAAEPGTERSVVVPVELQRSLGFTTGEARLEQVSLALEVPGQTLAPAGSEQKIQSPVLGTVMGEAIPQVGDRVHPGQVLAEVQELHLTAEETQLKGHELEVAARRYELEVGRVELERQRLQLEGELAAGSTRLAQMRSQLKRSEELYAISAIPLKELEAARFQARAAEQEQAGLKKALERLSRPPGLPELPAAEHEHRFALRSSLDGVVSQREHARGEVVEAGALLFTIVDLSTIWVEARVSESELPAVRRAGRAEIVSPGAERKYAGRLVSVRPRIDPRSRTAGVLFEVDNRRLELLEGMSARVRLLGGRREVVTVPADAVLGSGDKSVFVQVTAEEFEARTVEVDRVQSGRAWIRTGLEPGQKVLVRGAGQLASELAKRAR
ncbi:MAG: hypothetical protein AMXMBFR33_10230 [Candidatus Xenobia bacterium]